MTHWNPRSYLHFGDERTRPSIDLASRIAIETPETIIDLGCGPGNSTQVLRQRWPQACITGLDSSVEMIDTARTEYPNEQWVLSDIKEWCPGNTFNVVFSNAALQWIPDHGHLVERLFGYVADGGALAFQIPSADFALVRILIHEIAIDGPWASRMAGPLHALTMEPPSFYYDHLSPLARSVDIWETEYFHVMTSPLAIVDWIASTGLRPFLKEIESESEADQFVTKLRQRINEAYLVRPDGQVLFPFKRTFVIAYS